MNHDNHVDLLRGGILQPGGVWADIGSGTGAFTLALAELIGESGIIHSVDRDGGALHRQQEAMRAGFPAVTVHYQKADFTHMLDLPPLDGMVMANALHFQRHKLPVLKKLLAYLKPGGCFIVVEYNTDSGNMWVPHPFSYSTWEKMAQEAGLVETRLLDTYPSRFLREIYSAASIRS